MEIIRHAQKSKCLASVGVLITLELSVCSSGKEKKKGKERKQAQCSKYCQGLSLKYVVYFGIELQFLGFQECKCNSSIFLFPCVFLARSCVSPIMSLSRFPRPPSPCSNSLFICIFTTIHLLSYPFFPLRFHKVS